MGKLTYLDKVALNENTDIPDINKVKASDMNEIKNVVNGLVKTEKATTNEETYSCNYINGLGTKRTTLWSGEQSTTGEVSLSDSILNYDAIGIVISSNTPNNRRMDVFYVDDIKITTTGEGEINLSIFQSSSVWVSISGRFTANNKFNVVSVQKGTWKNAYLIAIYGIKF